jgi:bis(5'-nucleosyl)-tetraphosphatase (symmetrical)
MATWVLGDVHGQLEALTRLFARLGFEPRRDHLWLVGDLVSRGPSSLGVLRWARRWSERLGERMVVVLGNHDLRLLAFAAGLGTPKRRHLLDDVLEAPDRGELLAWLGRCPLLHRRDGVLLVHAGLLPDWTEDEAEARAREAEAELASGGARALLADWRGQEEVEDPRRERRRTSLQVLTGIRTCTSEGRPCDWSGPPEGAPAGCEPWFRWPGRNSAGSRIVFGHWAALGLHLEPRLAALDGGAAWGGRIVALRLEDGRIVEQPVASDPSGV